MKIPLYISTLITITFLTLVNIASAEQNSSDGYLFSSDNYPVMDNYNNCWKTSSWTPDMAIVECDPGLVKAVAVEPPKAPMKPAVIVLSLESGTLFEFGKSTISAKGRQQLDNQVIEKMNEYPQIKMVTITGHTDLIGSEAYNQKLSQQRADAVNDYLVGQGIASSRTQTEGRGESDPVVSCTGITGKINSKNAKLIECLKPNRRVVIEITNRTTVQQ